MAGTVDCSKSLPIHESLNGGRDISDAPAETGRRPGLFSRLSVARESLSDAIRGLGDLGRLRRQTQITLSTPSAGSDTPHELDDTVHDGVAASDAEVDTGPQLTSAFVEVDEAPIKSLQDLVGRVLVISPGSMARVHSVAFGYAILELNDAMETVTLSDLKGLNPDVFKSFDLSRLEDFREVVFVADDGSIYFGRFASFKDWSTAYVDFHTVRETPPNANDECDRKIDQRSEISLNSLLSRRDFYSHGVDIGDLGTLGEEVDSRIGGMAAFEHEGEVIHGKVVNVLPQNMVLVLSYRLLPDGAVRCSTYQLPGDSLVVFHPDKFKRFFGKIVTSDDVTGEVCDISEDGKYLLVMVPDTKKVSSDTPDRPDREEFFGTGKWVDADSVRLADLTRNEDVTKFLDHALFSTELFFDRPVTLAHDDFIQGSFRGHKFKRNEGELAPGSIKILGEFVRVLPTSLDRFIPYPNRKVVLRVQGQVHTVRFGDIVQNTPLLTELLPPVSLHRGDRVEFAFARDILNGTVSDLLEDGSFEVICLDEGPHKDRIFKVSLSTFRVVSFERRDTDTPALFGAPEIDVALSQESDAVLESDEPEELDEATLAELLVNDEPTSSEPATSDPGDDDLEAHFLFEDGSALNPELGSELERLRAEFIGNFANVEIGDKPSLLKIVNVGLNPSRPTEFVAVFEIDGIPVVKPFHQISNVRPIANPAHLRSREDGLLGDGEYADVFDGLKQEVDFEDGTDIDDYFLISEDGTQMDKLAG